MEEVALVTEDRWMKEGGRLDAADVHILAEASQNGRARVRVINMQEMLEAMKKTEPAKFRDFQETMEKQEGKSLSFEDLTKLGQKADERMVEFAGLVQAMPLGEAAQVRLWRVETHMTWRRVARQVFGLGWYNESWWPPSNQIMGMALCEKAALFFAEKFREPPWN